MSTDTPLYVSSWDIAVSTPSSLLKAKVRPSLQRIPSVMNRKGWRVGAALMQRWFASGANANPLQGVPDTMSVKMDSWVLTFPRAMAAYRLLMEGRVWSNAPAKVAIGALLRQRGLLGSTIRTFGDFSLPVPQLDQDYIQFRPVGYPILDPVDDLFAALGKFTFRIVVKGDVSPQWPARHQVTIRQVGIYGRDSYDFNGDQSLGYWDLDNAAVAKFPFTDRFVEITNADFRNWRQSTQKGGDFLVFSDLKIEKLASPDAFII